MKSFTAKEFSRCPAKVYEAAREDGKAEITHDRFNGKFFMVFVANEEVESLVNEIEGSLRAFTDRNRNHLSGADITHDNGDGTFSFSRPKPYDHEFTGDYTGVTGTEDHISAQKTRSDEAKGWDSSTFAGSESGKVLPFSEVLSAAQIMKDNCIFADDLDQFLDPNKKAPD